MLVQQYETGSIDVCMWVIGGAFAAILAAVVIVIDPTLRISFGFTQASLLMLCGIAAVVDLMSRRIPNRLTYPGMLLLLGLSVLGAATAGFSPVATEWLNAPTLLSTLGGVCFFLVAGIVVFASGGMGGGDAKLLTLVGAGFGLEVGLTAGFNAMAIAAIIALLNYVSRGGLITRLRVALATMMTAILTRRIAPEFSFERTEIPLALPILLGCISVFFIDIFGAIMSIIDRLLGMGGS